jgi:hypothetical protein
VSNTLRDATGDLVLPRVLVSDPASVALQGIRDILGLWQGEFFLDQSAGFPWLSFLGQTNPNTTQIAALLQQAILAAPYVISVKATSSFDRALRAFSYNFAAQLNTGEVVTGGSNQAFQVSGGG